MSVIKERIVNQGHGALTPSYFCVHSTANPGATAANHASLWSRDYPNAVHLVSDWTEALHCVPYDRLCWQVGNGNRYVEGLEICEATNQADFQRGIEIAAQAVRERLAAHGWGIDRLICHNEASARWGGSDHTDPIPYFAKWGYSWEQFKQLIAEGETDMAAKTDPISYGGMNVTVEYALQDLNNKITALTNAIKSLPTEIWYSQSNGDIKQTPLYTLRNIEYELTKTDKKDTKE